MMQAPRLPLLAVLSLPAIASGSPPLRYGDKLAVAPRAPLAARVEAQVEALARRAGPRRSDGSPALRRDAHLEAALDILIANLPRTGPPPGSTIEQALWLAGIVEPAPYLLTMVAPAGADEDVLRQIEQVLPPVLARGRYSRAAASMATDSAGRRRLAVALQESFLELGNVPRALPGRGRTAIQGSVLAPYRAPALFVTAPEGTVYRLASAGRGDGGTFSAVFRCGARAGRYQIEIAAEDPLGEAVLANFPIACGTRAATAMDTAPAAASTPGATRAAAPPEPARPDAAVQAETEAEVLSLLQKDRAAAGLAPVIADGRIAAIARAHSAAMRDQGFFGHLSPTTGSAMDRLTRAGIAAFRVRENLARACSAVELERGLMGSPSHRANLLAKDVDRVGIGIAIGATDPASGSRDLFLTQVFAQLPERFDEARVEAALRARVAAIRREGQAPPIAADRALDQVAKAVASGLAAGTLDPGHSRDDDPVGRSLPALAERYRWVRKVSGMAIDVSQLAASSILLDRDATHAGIAVAPGRPEPGGTAPIWLVVLLAAKR